MNFIIFILFFFLLCVFSLFSIRSFLNRIFLSFQLKVNNRTKFDKHVYNSVSSQIRGKVTCHYLRQRVHTGLRSRICESPRQLTTVKPRNRRNVDDRPSSTCIAHQPADVLRHQPSSFQVCVKNSVPFILRQVQWRFHIT